MSNLLLIEDDQGVRCLLREALERRGWRVTSCEEGATAIALAERESFDVAICDVILPDMNGFDVGEHLDHLQPTCTTLFITGYLPDFLETKFGARAARHAILQKPFKLVQLVNRLERLIAPRPAQSLPVFMP